jgi:hypothetical protein
VSIGLHRSIGEDFIMNPLRELADKLMISAGGQSLAQAKATGTCTRCKQPVAIDTFKDELSIKEYGISGLCQACQDFLFNDEEMEDSIG